MLKNIAALSLLILVGAIASAVSASHPGSGAGYPAESAPMERVKFFDEKFVATAANRQTNSPADLAHRRLDL